MGRVPKSRGEKTSLVAAIGLDEGVSDAMTSTGAVAGVAFLAYLEHPLAPRPRPGQIVVLDRLGGAPQTGGAGGDRSAGVRVGAVAWVRPGLQPQRVGFQQDRGVRESCGGEDEGALDSAIAAALGTVSLGDVVGWSEHAGVTNHSL